ncbi:MAG: gliding motility-associated ABC transporter permease subunit GldF [Bacteroidales bacterium]|jgi:ABC-2 type transport system permease protein|nr:gliding motility-associated ABC transporter permease subunit GldF [Bacteroidales bacterium]MDD2204403.1 gliding motility-associated ABC transporter permease subunit GldF [Bacteroidales bacterium]MDD3152359.1 gliding motility-associated ABC transporter permease subunit GldF [Bacteroidales bacterium]MDD3913825.1 gliding motility-associated ABC transporter permease subunit GldF [Bacteroidales bacterium]MDD4634324.1 gliding motility-associated ABC transporter permease subunit GldF [Bacteroidales
MFAILKKELSSFFASLTGYIVILVFLIITGLILWVIPGPYNIVNYGYANIDGLFDIAPYVFLFLIPAITMRSFAEEKRSGTFELISTKPISSLQIVLGKYFADCIIVLLSLLPTIIFYITVYKLGAPIGNIDSGAVWGSYAGLLLLGMSFAAIGVFCSSLTDNQIVSFVIAALICAFLYIGFEAIYSMRIFGDASLFIKSLGMQAHFMSISRGVIDTRDIIYYLSVIFIFLMFTKFSIERRR